jgi:penicillin-binding protein 2
MATLDFPCALQHSCDVYFYQVGINARSSAHGGGAASPSDGDKTGIDLPQERRGLIPSQAWYDKRWGVNGWRKGTLLTWRSDKVSCS